MIEVTIVASVEAGKAAILEWVSEPSGRNSKSHGARKVVQNVTRAAPFRN